MLVLHGHDTRGHQSLRSEDGVLDARQVANEEKGAHWSEAPFSIPNPNHSAGMRAQAVPLNKPKQAARSS
jgi:hypothetical protein